MSAEVKVCEIDPEVKELGHKFRFRRAKNSAAVVFKIDAGKQLVVLDEEHEGCKPEQHMMYSGSKLNLVKELGATKVFELRSVDEMTEEWLVEKLKFFR